MKALGVALVVLHAVGFAVAMDRCQPVVLQVVAGVPNRAVEPRVTGTGLQRELWEQHYRGGFIRRVGRTRLRPPFQSSARPPCGVRLHIGQAFLDDGAAGQGTLAAHVVTELERRLAGTEILGLGSFRGVGRLSLTWSEGAGGSLAVFLELAFGGGRVPLEISLAPRLVGTRLSWQTSTAARVRLGSRWKRGLVSLLRLQDNIDEWATDEGSVHVHEVAAALEETFALPPAIDLGGGRALRLAYCSDVPVLIRDRATATVSLAVLPAADARGPVALSHGDRELPSPNSSVPITVDIDLDATNAVLQVLWAAGYFDEQLAAAPSWFNEAELVQRYLSVRMESVSLSMPPTVERDDTRFALGAEAGFALVDGSTRTPARLFGRVGFGLRSEPGGRLVSELELAELELTCEPGPEVLAPCYGGIVDAVRGSAARLHTPVAAAIGERFDDWVRSRSFGAGPRRERFSVESAGVTTMVDGESGWIRLRVEGRIVAPP